MSEWPEYSLANSIHKLFMRLDKASIQRLFKEVVSESRKRGMIYEEEDGTTRLIPLMLRPRLISARQRAYFLNVCYHMTSAFQKLGQLFLKVPQVQKLFPFSLEEREWIASYFPKDPHEPHTVIARWDANTNFSGKDWKASFQFLEANAVGVGGFHYTPTLERIILEVVLNTLRPLDPNLQVRPNDDIRQILLWELQSHLKALGKRRCHIALVQDNWSKGGPLDFIFLEKFFKTLAIQAKVIDPRELTVKRGQIMAKDLPVDILYRDSTLEEFIEMEKEEGKPLKAVRKAFSENIVVSGLGGELDHKSAFEVFSHPQFERYFNQEERKYFKRHVPWTRLIRPTKTIDAEGKTIDLVTYTLSHREELVLKPNRSYGGEGILMGSATPSGEWEKAIQKAIQESGFYTVQKRCPVRRKKFPVLDANGGVIEKSLNVVCGFIYSPYGLGILGRASAGNIVNVAQQGGMTAILICENR